MFGQEKKRKVCAFQQSQREAFLGKVEVKHVQIELSSNGVMTPLIKTSANL